MSGQTGPSVLPGPAGARPNVSRRNVLIGAGAGGITVAAGVAAWVIGSRSLDASSSHTPGEPATAGKSLQADGRTNASGAGHASMAWTFTTGDEILSNPGVGSGVVYVGSKDNHLYAVDAATGKMIWKYPLGWVAAAPQVVNGMVCAATVEGEFSAISVATGVRAWRQQTGTPAVFKPNWAVDQGTVILPSITAPLTVYDVVTGSKGTTTFGQPGQFAGGAIGVANGVLYAIQESGAMFAVQIATATVLWKRYVSSNASVFTSVVISHGAIYITDDSGMLYSLNAANGKSNWSYPAGDGGMSTPVASGGMVYVTDDSGLLHAITTAAGSQVWTHQTVTGGDIGPAVSGGTLYVSTGQGLQALDAKTGDTLWSYTPAPPGALVSTPAVAGGLVFIGSTNDNLYAIRV